MNDDTTTYRTAGRAKRRTLRAAAILAATLSTAVTGLGALSTSADAARPPTTISTGGVVVKGVHVNGVSRNYSIVREGQHVVVTGHYANHQPGTSLDQIQIGWAGADNPLGCVYDEGRGDPATGSFRYDLGVPPAGQVNQVIINFAQDWYCGASTPGWWFGNDGPAIAEVVTRPADHAQTDLLGLSDVRVDGRRSNVVTANNHQPVRVTGHFDIGDTGGAIDQVTIGWEGSDAPSACGYVGGGNTSGDFDVTLPAPPNKGANFIVYDLGQDYSCNTTAWWHGNTPPTAPAVGLVYNNRLPRP